MIAKTPYLATGVKSKAKPGIRREEVGDGAALNRIIPRCGPVRREWDLA
jgi:hypothetical protein